jgi:hypothetical protein
MYDLGGYVHCRATKKGKYTLYEGGWGEPREGYCDVSQLRVVRSEANKPIQFQSLEEAYVWAKARGRLPTSTKTQAQATRQ